MRTHKSPFYSRLCYKIEMTLVLQLRKMEKDRILFLDEKRNAMAKRERLLDTLKRERQQLQDRLMALRHGPHARNESKVNI